MKYWKKVNRVGWIKKTLQGLKAKSAPGAQTSHAGGGNNCGTVKPLEIGQLLGAGSPKSGKQWAASSNKQWDLAMEWKKNPQ